MNKFKNLILLIFALIILPAASILIVGCGATAVNQVKAVAFVSSQKNEQGQAVFELDLDSSVKLPYKVNPSSAYGYTPLFDVVDGMYGANKETYTLDNFTGEFVITRDDFTDVKVSISLGNYTDICHIKLKKYPTKIGVYDETAENKVNETPKINLACGAAYQIDVVGIIDGKVKLLQDSDYNFLVEVDKESKEIINLPDKHRLNFVAYNNYGPAKVRVAICDYFGNVIKDEAGNAQLAFEIEINVYQTCEYMDVYLEGASKILSSQKGQNIASIKASDILKQNGKYEINYDVDLYGKNTKIEDETIELYCSVNKTTFIDIDQKSQKIVFKNIPQGSGRYEFAIRIRSSAMLENNEFCTILINVIVDFRL